MSYSSWSLLHEAGPIGTLDTVCVCVSVLGGGAERDVV